MIGEPGDSWYENAGKVVGMALVSAFLFWMHGKEHPEKMKRRQDRWTFDLPDKAVERLQLIGLIGAVVGFVGVGLTYELFWDEWDTTARTIWVIAAIVVTLMVVLPIVILWTRRREKAPGADDDTAGTR